MTGWVRPVGWLVANVAVAVLVGLLGCADATIALGVLIVASAVAQTLSLLSLASRFWLWLPVTLVGTALAFYASLFGVAMTFDTHAFDAPLRIPGLHDVLPGSTLGIVIGATAGWLVLAIAQSFALWFARRRWSWWWIPSVMVGGVGLDPLGVATLGRAFSSPAPVAFPSAPPPPCDALSVSGGAVLLVAGALWYGLITLLVLRSSVRVSRAATIA